MQTIHTSLRTRAPCPVVRSAPRSARPTVSRAVLRVRCDSDDDMIPIIKGATKKGFTPKEYEMLKNPKLLGGKTVGEELELIRQQYLSSEQQMAKAHQTTLVSDKWDGDVYLGGNWNELSIIYLIFLLAPALVGIFAWATYGTLWATGAYY